MKCTLHLHKTTRLPPRHRVQSVSSADGIQLCAGNCRFTAVSRSLRLSLSVFEYRGNNFATFIDRSCWINADERLQSGSGHKVKFDEYLICADNSAESMTCAILALFFLCISCHARYIPDVSPILATMRVQDDVTFSNENRHCMCNAFTMRYNVTRR